MIEKIFQILFILIMSVGILGLPLYFVLLARKKRIVSEFDENTDADRNDSES